MNTTIAIITGDIIDSRKVKPETWLPYLKKALSTYGKEPTHWEIYRGDSFQLEIPSEKALEAAIHIKASLKQNKGLDVRLGIGLGKKDYDSDKITESNGSAFVYSGECFENLKKQTLALKSDVMSFDVSINLMLELATLTMNNWLPATARVVKTAIENPKANQKELASLLETTQSNISEALLRAGFDEVQKLIYFYKSQLAKL
ncbi:transcriptional regulator [Flagellimonas sp. HMM57]|uniref:transcriptional regulator n=1 Tax=unclassified Flagellimonas TaxID=2644544 RepID=UPI0013D2664D|nr:MULTISPECIES: transcriptional regulator [unclassified Flagellimonas]UII74832.1 transcriptional regulator [Flagellimonas sp. HMM57]